MILCHFLLPILTILCYQHWSFLDSLWCLRPSGYKTIRHKPCQHKSTIPHCRDLKEMRWTSEDQLQSWSCSMICNSDKMYEWRFSTLISLIYIFLRMIFEESAQVREDTPHVAVNERGSNTMITVSIVNDCSIPIFLQCCSTSVCLKDLYLTHLKPIWKTPRVCQGYNPNQNQTFL